MTKDDALMVPNAENSLKINKSLHKPYYYIFQDELKDNKFITREIRANIINRWLQLTPKIPKINLQNYLHLLEQRYWASIAPWEAKALTSKIIHQTMDMQEKIVDSTDKSELSMLTKKNTAIIKGNELIAKVAQLIDQPAAATFVINTNIDDSQMAMEMNGIEEAEVIDTESNDD